VDAKNNAFKDVSNSGIDNGNEVYISDNPLDCDDAATRGDIAALEERGINLYYYYLNIDINNDIRMRILGRACHRLLADPPPLNRGDPTVAVIPFSVTRPAQNPSTVRIL
jgi:hypothetical protein